MSFTIEPCAPSWALPLALVAIGLLLAFLVGLMLLPLERGPRRENRRPPDPHAEPFGDQPKLPADKAPS